jgi:myo-inositol-1(or 4)-monophosphatase
MRARRTGRGSGCVVQQRGTVHHVCSNWLKQPGFVKPPIVEAGFGCGKAGSGRGMDKDEIAGLVQAAEQLAAMARRETLRPEVLEAADKNEGGAFDPVTEADRGAERVMREWIGANLPDHAISGEEYGETAGNGPWRWSLDPIDGTRAYICGLPSWTTLIALLLDGRPVVGIIDAPRLDELSVGTPEGAWLRTGGASRRLRTSGCRSLAEARFSTTDAYLFAGEEAEAFERVRRAARLTRYGLDAYGYARVAAGALDLVIESGLKPHDYNALMPVVRGAGGVMGNWRGEDEFGEGKVVAAATPELFEEAVRLLAA